MLYFVRFEVHQPEDMPSKRFLEIWYQEAQAALKAKEAGAIKGLWKVSGQRVVLAVVDPPSHDVLDQALAGLPVIQELGGSVKTEARPIRPYEEFAEDLRKAVESR